MTDFTISYSFCFGVMFGRWDHGDEDIFDRGWFFRLLISGPIIIPAFLVIWIFRLA